RPGADRGEQVAQLVLDFPRVSYRLGDLRAEQLGVAPPQAVYRHLDRLLAQAEPVGDAGVRLGGVLARERALESVEQRLFAGVDQLVAESGQGLLQQGQRPAPREEGLRRRGVGGLELVLALAGLKVERQQRPAAAALLGVGAVALLRQEALERGQQERAEPAALRVGRPEVVLFEDAGEKLLGQVLRVLRAGHLAPGVG